MVCGRMQSGEILDLVHCLLPDAMPPLASSTFERRHHDLRGSQMQLVYLLLNLFPLALPGCLVLLASLAHLLQRHLGLFCSLQSESLECLGIN